MNSQSDSAPASELSAPIESTATHIPVFAARTLELFEPAIEAAARDGRPPIIVDGTLGLGGHSARLLAAFPALRILGVDRDPYALEIASRRLAAFSERFTAVHCRFDDMDAVAAAGNLTDTVEVIDGTLLDFGVSSMQLDTVDRGFAYSVDAPLDMRMNPEDEFSAADIINNYERFELGRIFRDYGEERFARQIAAAICRRREVTPFSRTGELVELLYDTIPAGARRTGGHPAKRVFQALRIEVNRELESVRSAVPAHLDALRVGGRAVFMSYHSLEDRVVKREIATRTSSSSPADLPVDLPGTEPKFVAVTRGAEQADEAEISTNPRSASVRVRCVERSAGRQL